MMYLQVILPRMMPVTSIWIENIVCTSYEKLKSKNTCRNRGFFKLQDLYLNANSEYEYPPFLIV